MYARSLRLRAKILVRLQPLSVPSTEFYVIEARGLVRASANRRHNSSDVQVVRALIEKHAAKFIRAYNIGTNRKLSF